MKLYDAAWAPSPRRVRMYLMEKGIEVDRVAIDLRENEQLGDAYLAINPRGVVPALELDDGEVICESAAICRYFEALHPEPPLFGRTALEIARIEAWTRRIESDGYAAVVSVFRNNSPRWDGRAEPGKRPPIPAIADLVTRGTLLWGAFVDDLEARLATTPWMAGDAFSFADITGLMTIDFAERAKLPIPEGHGHLRDWHQRASARPSAKA